jgi:hypothetical protein
MADTALLNELLDTGEALAPHEAVAIVQQLMTTDGSDADEDTVGSEDVVLHRDGLVKSRVGVPSTQSLGGLLDTMLPCGNGVRVSGALRFTIARACNSVDAPGFESRAAFSTALERFEQGPREDVVRELLVRTGLSFRAPAPDSTSKPERRISANVAALRRELREADARLFASLQQSAPTPAPQHEIPAASPLRTRWVAVTA